MGSGVSAALPFDAQQRKGEKTKKLGGAVFKLLFHFRTEVRSVHQSRSVLFTFDQVDCAFDREGGDHYCHGVCVLANVSSNAEPDSVCSDDPPKQSPSVTAVHVYGRCV